MDNIYNENVLVKNIGYFQVYTYKYADYIVNKNILNPFIIKNNVGLLCVSKEAKVESNLSGILNFNDYNYNDFIDYVYQQIKNQIISFDNLPVKEKNKVLRKFVIIIKIWIFKLITKERLRIRAQLLFNKKLLKFQTVINKLIDYKVKVGLKQQQFSRFLTERILTKELKPYIIIKIKDIEKQDLCLNHLLNLMTKKWLNVDPLVFKYYIHKTIKKYQDNYEHDDAWELKVEEKKKKKNEK